MTKVLAGSAAICVSAMLLGGSPVAQADRWLCVVPTKRRQWTLYVRTSLTRS